MSQREPKTTAPLPEIERLRAAVDFCRRRLKRDAYRDTLDAILRGDKDDSIRNPDHTEIAATASSSAIWKQPFGQVADASSISRPIRPRALVA